MEVFERNGKWVWRKQPGIQFSFDTKEEAYAAADIEMPAEIPMPKVKEYASIEEALEDLDEEDAV